MAAGKFSSSKITLLLYSKEELFSAQENIYVHRKYQEIALSAKHIIPFSSFTNILKGYKKELLLYFISQIPTTNPNLLTIIRVRRLGNSIFSFKLYLIWEVQLNLESQK